jgi:poly(3-hydroxybutyrate) depolymerase
MLRALLLLPTASLLAAPILSSAFPAPTNAAQPTVLLQEDEEPAAETPEEPTFEPRLDDRDHKKLAQLLEELNEARRQNEDSFEAREDLDNEIARLERKNEGFRLVASPADLESVVLQSIVRKDNASKGRAKAFEIKRSNWGHPIPYAFHGPKSYKVSKGPYPLVVIVPPAGEEKLDMYLKDTWTDAALLEDAVLAVAGMPEDLAAWKEIGEPGQAGGLANVLQVMKAATDTYLIDPNRIFLVGHREGAATAVHMASMFGDRFAGVATLGGDVEGTPATNFRNLPTLIAAGGSGATAFEEDVEERGYGNCTRLGEYTLPDFWEWARDRRRALMPGELFLAPPNQYAAKAYWLKLDGFDPNEAPLVTAAVDRSTNTITLTGRGVTSVWISFNDRLLDLSQPVTVVLNGEGQQHEIQRNLSTTLDVLVNTGDPGRLIVAQMKYDFPLEQAPSGGEASDTSSGE